MNAQVASAVAAVAVGLGLDAHAGEPAVAPGTDSKPQPVALAKVVTSIPSGTPWATFQKKGNSFSGWECFPRLGVSDKLTWRTDGGGIDTRKYLPIFASEMKSAGLVAADDPDDLFQKKRGEADLQVAGNIKKINANLCLNYISSGVHFSIGADSRPRLADGPPPTPDLDRVYGDISFDIDWQVYSRSADRVVAEVEITSTFANQGHVQGSYDKLIEGGVRENIKQLIASPAFRAVATTAPSPYAIHTDAQPKIDLIGGSQARPARISDAVGSVMVVFSGGGHGSGFLVSSDGYIMTAEHVVGSDKYVKIRWSDGLEGVGEVVRTDKRRDVALIKADPRGRQPLALRRSLPQPGDTVFAIGAPIDPKLQSTVTRGVASANRIMDGFSFIQSDVTVDPGNSGGPLLDEKGQVLGFTDLGFRTPEAPTGLNFFVPIDDALRFLSAEPR